MKIAAAFVGLGVVVACSGGSGSNTAATAGASNDVGGGPNGAAGNAGSGVSGNAGAATVAGGSNNPGAAGANAGSGGTDLELPAGSREVDGVVNLVDAAAAAELDQFMLDESLIYPTVRHGLSASLNLFLEHYQENYDFVFFFTDHLLPTAIAAAKFEAVTRPAAAGGASEIEIATATYETTGRVKGVIGGQYNGAGLPALAHETLHYWANYLDDKFGFGKALDDANATPVHWGYSSVSGQLGGFDGSTLRCETPAGAVPPNCTPLANGRTRYVTGIYAPSTNTFRDLPYAPLELYLMGLAPASEVPPSIQMLTDATFPEFSDDQLTATTEATGVVSLNFADIQARHGTPQILPDDARHFSAAFVILSSTPVPDSFMTDLSTGAAVFGNRKKVNGAPSFEEYTGARATMNTALGARRKVGMPPPAARAASSCDLIAQTCSRPELACYSRAGTVCALSGNLPLNAACSADFACARGLDCVGSSATSLKCQPYCDPNPSATSASACNTLCPGNFATYEYPKGTQVGAICVLD